MKIKTGFTILVLILFLSCAPEGYYDYIIVTNKSSLRTCLPGDQIKLDISSKDNYKIERSLSNPEWIEPVDLYNYRIKEDIFSSLDQSFVLTSINLSNNYHAISQYIWILKDESQEEYVRIIGYWKSEMDYSDYLEFYSDGTFYESAYGNSYLWEIEDQSILIYDKDTSELLNHFSLTYTMTESGEEQMVRKEYTEDQSGNEIAETISYRFRYVSKSYVP